MSARRLISPRSLIVVAVLLIVYAIISSFGGRPQAVLREPELKPAQSPARAVVAGAGLVQPPGELIGLGAPVGGIVSRVAVTVGDVVKARQLVFEIDAQEVQAEIQAQSVALDVARRNLNVARIEEREQHALLDIDESIDDEGAVNHEERTRRRFAYAIAHARAVVAAGNVEQAARNLSRARTVLTRHQVRAPLDAVVLKVNARPGEFAPAAQLAEPLVTLGRTGALQAKIDIDEADIPRLAVGAPAQISVRGRDAAPVQARFVRVEPLVIPKRSLTNSGSERVDTRVLQVIFELPPDSQGFYVGQQVDAYVPATAPDEAGASAARSSGVVPP